MSELIRLFSALDTFILRVSINLCLYDDHIPKPFCTVFDHAPKVRAVIIRTRHSAVDVGIEDDDIVLLRILFADMELTFDRLLCLLVARISRVNYCCLHLKPPEIFAFIVHLNGRE